MNSRIGCKIHFSALTWRWIFCSNPVMFFWPQLPSRPKTRSLSFSLCSRAPLFLPLPDKLFHFPLKISPGRPSRDGSLRSSSVSYTSIYIFLSLAPELLAPLVCVPSRERERAKFPFFALARSLFACLRDKVQLHSPPPPSGPFLLSFANADVTTHTPSYVCDWK